MSSVEHRPDQQYSTPEINDEQQLARKAQNRDTNNNFLIRVGVGTAAAAAVVGAALGIQHATRSDKITPDPDQAASSAPAVPGEKGSAVSIDQITQKTSEAQIQYMLDHPVLASEYTTPEERLTAIGKRLAAIINSGEVDLDKPIGENGYYPFTSSYQPVFDSLVETIYDKNSSGYPTLYAALETTTQNTTAFLSLNNDMLTTLTPVEGSGHSDGNIDTVIGVIDNQSRSNPAFVAGDPMKVEFSLVVGPDGVVRVEHTQELDN